jgi:hypothetical protein
MKKLLVFSLLFSITVCSQTYLNIHYSDGTDNYVEVSSIQKITLNATGTEISFQLNTGIYTENTPDVHTLTFGNTPAGGMLPVELTSFTAATSSASTGSATAVVLNWTTATEVNNYGFEVERSLVIGHQSLENWEVIGFVEGHGNSNSPKEYSFVDACPFGKNPPSGNLKYRLKQIDTDGTYEYYGTIAEINFNPTGMEENALPTEFSLSQNYPNPFNPATTISYSIPSSLVPTHVSLIVYNTLGQQVATLVNEQKATGNYEVKFNGSQFASGVYYYELRSDNYRSIKKFMLVK